MGKTQGRCGTEGITCGVGLVERQKTLVPCRLRGQENQTPLMAGVEGWWELDRSHNL